MATETVRVFFSYPGVKVKKQLECAAHVQNKVRCRLHNLKNKCERAGWKGQTNG